MTARVHVLRAIALDVERHREPEWENEQQNEPEWLGCGHRRIPKLLVLNGLAVQKTKSVLAGSAAIHRNRAAI
jgi:hypothetical protein